VAVHSANRCKKATFGSLFSFLLTEFATLASRRCDRRGPGACYIHPVMSKPVAVFGFYFWFSVPGGREESL